jgi:hypothetical protein
MYFLNKKTESYSSHLPIIGAQNLISKPLKAKGVHKATATTF